MKEAVPLSGNVITAAQRKQADKLSQTVQNLVSDLEQGIAEGDGGGPRRRTASFVGPQVQDRACAGEGLAGSHHPRAGRGLAMRLQFLLWLRTRSWRSATES